MSTDIVEISGPGGLGLTIAKNQAEAAATRAEQAKDQALPARDQTIAARDVTLAARDITTAARDEAVAARGVTEPASVAAVAARNDAVPARNEAVTARNEAIAARDQVLPARDAVLAARDLVLPAKDLTLAARDEAVAARDLAVPAKNLAVTARDEAVAARDVTVAARDVTTAARDVTTAARDITTAAKDNAAASATAAAAALAAMPASRATVAEADAATLNTKWVGPDGLVNRPLRKSASVVVNVAVGGDIQTAINGLNAYIFEGAATGDVVLAAGVHTLPTAAGLYCQHPQAAEGRIRVLGSGAPVLPVEADWTGVIATDQAMLRTKWPTTVVCPGNGVDVSAGAAGGLYVSKINFERQGAAGGYGLFVRGRRTLHVATIAATGFTNGLYLYEGARVAEPMGGSTAVMAHNSLNVALSYACSLELALIAVYATANVNISVANDSRWVSVLASQVRNGVGGINATADSSVVVNLAHVKECTTALAAGGGSSIYVTSAGTIFSAAAGSYLANITKCSRLVLGTITLDDANPAGPRTIYCNDNSRAHVGVVTGTAIYSPALQTLGNDNSYISA